MTKKQLILNGENIATIDDFYDEVQNVLTKDFKHFGRNFHAFNDVLRGGFLVFELGEPIVLILKNFNRVKKRLGDGFYNKIIKIIEKHEHIELVVE